MVCGNSGNSAVSLAARAGKVGQLVVGCFSVDFAKAKISGSGEAGEAGDFLAPQKKQGVWFTHILFEQLVVWTL